MEFSRCLKQQQHIFCTGTKRVHFSHNFTSINVVFYDGRCSFADRMPTIMAVVLMECQQLGYAVCRSYGSLLLLVLPKIWMRTARNFAKDSFCKKHFTISFTWGKIGMNFRCVPIYAPINVLMILEYILEIIITWDDNNIVIFGCIATTRPLWIVGTPHENRPNDVTTTLGPRYKQQLQDHFTRNW